MNLVIFDCENCATELIEKQLRHIIYSDIVLVIGAMQSIHKYREIAPKAEIIKCKETKRNTADFVIVATVSRKMAEKEYDKAIIISNDTGFDSAVNYFNSEGLNVVRCKPNKLIMTPGLKEVCRVLLRDYSSGVKFDTVINDNKRMYWGNIRKLLNELNSLGIIKIRKIKVKQIYFSKETLKKIVMAKNKL